MLSTPKLWVNLDIQSNFEILYSQTIDDWHFASPLKRGYIDYWSGKSYMLLEGSFGQRAQSVSHWFSEGPMLKIGNLGCKVQITSQFNARKYIWLRLQIVVGLKVIEESFHSGESIFSELFHFTTSMVSVKTISLQYIPLLIEVYSMRPET